MEAEVQSCAEKELGPGTAVRQARGIQKLEFVKLEVRNRKLALKTSS